MNKRKRAILICSVTVLGGLLGAAVWASRCFPGSPYRTYRQLPKGESDRLMRATLNSLDAMNCAIRVYEKDQKRNLRNFSDLIDAGCFTAVPKNYCLGKKGATRVVDKDSFWGQAWISCACSGWHAFTESDKNGKPHIVRFTPNCDDNGGEPKSSGPEHCRRILWKLKKEVLELGIIPKGGALKDDSGYE